MTETAKKHVNSLLECAMPLFALTVQVRRRGDEPPDGFRDRVMAGFDTLERMAFERQIPTASVQDAKYALAAFIDEAVLASEWPGRMDWMSQPLQVELFGEHVAGERFFEKLAALRQGGEQNLNLMELYYTCLQFGFEGIYRIKGLESLMALQVDLRGQIDGYRGVVDPRLAADGVPKMSIVARVSRDIPYWVIGVVTLGVVFFSYLGYTTVLASKVDASLKDIAVDHAVITTRSSPGNASRVSEAQ